MFVVGSYLHTLPNIRWQVKCLHHQRPQNVRQGGNLLMNIEHVDATHCYCCGLTSHSCYKQSFMHRLLLARR